MTRTAIPRNLKKKLSASLESLTPRQAGRLLLIYYTEASEKSFEELKRTAAVEDLDAAWDKRLAAAKRGGPQALTTEAKLYNGYIFLKNLIFEIEVRGRSDMWRLLFGVQSITSRLDKLLLADAFSETARIAAGWLLQGPQPLSREDYDRLQDWATRLALIDLDDVASDVSEAWAKDQDFRTFEVPNEVAEEAVRELVADPAALAVASDEQIAPVAARIRRHFVETQGDQLLEEVFAGNRDDLEHWVESGTEYVRKADDEAVDAKFDEALDNLVAMVEAGELEGGLAITPRRCYEPILLDEAGTLPAWAALRAVWKEWTYDQGFFIKDTPTVHPKAILGVDTLFSADGDVKTEDLARLAGDFLADCKKRPWGRNLPAPKSVDLAALGFFLTTVETPLTAGEAPDIGRVDWDIFKQHEGRKSFLSGTRDPAPYYVATVGSLQAKGLYAWPVSMPGYYSTDNPEEIRQEEAQILRLLTSMRVSHRTFSYGREDKTALSNFLGVDFSTPLEESVTHLGEVFGMVATFKRTYGILSDRYFGGLPVFGKESQELAWAMDSLLEDAEFKLTGWLQTLQDTQLFDLDAASLKLVKGEANEEDAEANVDDMVQFAKFMSRLNDTDFDLGPEEPPAKGKHK